MLKAREITYILQNIDTATISQAENLGLFLESSGKEKLNSIKVKSVLFEVISLAKTKLRQVCETDECLSGDRLFNPSSDALSMACLKSALLWISQKRLNLKTEIKEASGDSNNRKESLYQQHLKRLESVIDKLKEIIDKNVQDATDSKDENVSIFNLMVDSIQEVEGIKAKSESWSSNNIYESEDNSLPWEKGAHAVKAEIDKKFRRSKQGLGGYIMRIYKHLRDTKKVIVMKEVLRMYERRTLTDKKFANQMQKDSSYEEVIGHKSFLRRHPLIVSYIGGPIFHKLARTVDNEEHESRFGNKEGEEKAGELQELGDSADLIGMYIAGREYGNTETSASGKRVGMIRRFYRRHPLISGILLGKPIHGWIYHKGQQDARAEDVHRALYAPE